MALSNIKFTNRDGSTQVLQNVGQVTFATDTGSNVTFVDGSNYYTKSETESALNLKQNITDNTLTTTAKTVGGAINELNNIKANKRAIKTSMDAVAVVNANYFLGTQTSVSVVLPSSATAGDMISVVFYSGATATTLSISGSYIGTLPTPTANQRVELNLLYDNTNWVLLSNVMSTS